MYPAPEGAGFYSSPTPPRFYKMAYCCYCGASLLEQPYPEHLADEKTTVSSEQSRVEIERTLKRYGATGFMYGWESNRAIIAFRAHNRMVRFELPMPDPDSHEFTRTPTRGTRRSQAKQTAAYEQAVRQRWRALALAIKAKLEAVDCGITDFESEFLAHILLPDGSTVGGWIQPQLEAAYERNQMPPMLPP